MSAAWCLALLAGDYAAAGYVRDDEGTWRTEEGVAVKVIVTLPPVMALPPSMARDPYLIGDACADPHAGTVVIPGANLTPHQRRKARSA